MKRTLLIIMLFLTLNIATAQEAFFMDASDLSVDISETQDNPPVSLKKTGDFLVLKVTIENDSREDTQRRSEIYSTIEKIAVDTKKGGRHI